MSRLAYLGTPELAVPPLHALVDAGHEITLVVSRADRRRGRGSATSPSPVKAAALELGLPVTSSLDDVADSGAELGVVVAFGRIIPADLLDLVPMVNLHFSLLPRWRGAAPVERAVLAGDAETGVCVMALEAGLDTGPVYDRRAVPIDPTESVEELRARLVGLGSSMLVGLLADGVGGLPVPEPQAGPVTYADKLSPEEFRLDFSRPAEELVRLVRLGRAFTEVRGRRLRVLRAMAVDRPAKAGSAAKPGQLFGQVVVAGQGALALLEVQPESSRPMDAGAWRRGAHLDEGELLGSAAGDAAAGTGSG